MRKLGLAVFLVSTLLAWMGSAQALGLGGPKSKPSVFCNVTKVPDPALLGGWKCTFKLELGKDGVDINPVKYWLVQVDNRYAVYFERIARDGRKRYSGWQAWTVNGNEITSGKEVRIYTENGEVFFCWKNERPVKMQKLSD